MATITHTQVCLNQAAVHTHKHIVVTLMRSIYIYIRKIAANVH